MLKGIDREDKVMLIVIGVIAGPVAIGLVATFILDALKIIYRR